MSATIPHTPDDAARVPQPNRLLRVAITILVIYWVILLTATHLPRVPEPLGFRPSDKIEHFAAYGLLAMLAAWVWSLVRPFGWRQGLVLLAVVAVHGVFDEVTQPLVGRNMDVRDWCADMVGATAGIGIFLLVQAAVSRWNASRSTGSGPVGIDA